jgi:hypothetical protein
MQKWSISCSDPNVCAAHASSAMRQSLAARASSTRASSPPAPPLSEPFCRAPRTLPRSATTLTSFASGRAQQQPFRRCHRKKRAVGGGPTRRPVLERAVDLEDAGGGFRGGGAGVGGRRWRPTDSLGSCEHVANDRVNVLCWRYRFFGSPLFKVLDTYLTSSGSNLDRFRWR